MKTIHNCRTTLVLGLCLLLSSCVDLSAVRDFSNTAVKASDLFPAVASLGYNACVNKEENDQLKAVKEFSENFRFDHAKIDENCAPEKATGERLEKTYNVLSAYMQTLGKLAADNVATYDTKKVVAQVPGLNAKQQGAVTGLANVITNAFTNGWRKRELGKAIELAEPQLQALAEALSTNLSGLQTEIERNQTDAIGSLYRQAAAKSEATSPIVLTELMLSQYAAIEKEKTAVAAFDNAIKAIARAHTKLYESRHNLADKAVAQEIFQTASDVQTQITAVEKVFKSR